MGGTGTLTVRTARDDDALWSRSAIPAPGSPKRSSSDLRTFFTTKPVGEGTGLGLDISWRIVVNRHHGDLTVESEPGDTRFQARLPLTAPDPETGTEPGPGPDETQETP